ncbi:MAG: FliA/WhiG family RNA polymerase sigma factor [Firmicutes bacterium]|nr:FliA/WhiG family RNA polymerase sigma factor [Bacillota bacterium]
MNTPGPEYEKYIKQWQPYLENRDEKSRNDIVLEYMDLVKKIVMRFRSSSSSYAQVDDMINQGIIALIDAVEKYDPYMGNKFETFATVKIRGAIIDLMRKQDWVPRNQRSLSKEVDEIYSALYAEYGREPTKEEMAAGMGITVAGLEKILEQRQSSMVLSYEEVINEKMQAATPLYANSGESETPESVMMQQELQDQLAAAIDALGEKERLVVSLYYYENLKLKEIAQVLGITESRVSQIHSAAIIKLKNRMTNYQKG